MYEEMLRVPLIIKLPRQDRAGVRVAAVSRAVDVMPTILEYLGVQPSADEMQGESLRAMWENPLAGHQRVAFSEAATTASEIKGVRTDRYKYVIRIDPSVVKEHGRAYVPDQVADRMLFDLASDPREQQNLLLAPGPVFGMGTELDTALRKFAAIHSPETDVVELDEQTIERLKALGYVQ
jgi:arylsulfatase A-like enzyme